MTDKERLEELKEWFNADEEMHEFQIEWLIKQAEKVQQYEIALDEIYSVAKFYRTDLVPDEVRNIIRQVR